MLEHSSQVRHLCGGTADRRRGRSCSSSSRGRTPQRPAALHMSPTVKTCSLHNPYTCSCARAIPSMPCTMLVCSLFHFADRAGPEIIGHRHEARRHEAGRQAARTIPRGRSPGGGGIYEQSSASKRSSDDPILPAIARPHVCLDKSSCRHIFEPFSTTCRRMAL